MSTYSPLAESPPVRPDIRHFTSYRAFLLALIPHLKETDPDFSYRVFSKRAGFSSPNYLKLVAEGQRNLAPVSIDKFVRGLGLSRREARIFRLMVLLEAARTDEERNTHCLRLLELVSDEPTARMRGNQFAVYQAWYPLVIREMAALPDFAADPAWIAQRLRPRITEAQARRALELLFETGLLVEDEDGHVVQADRRLTTGPIVRSLAVRNYHRAHLDLATGALDGVPQDERNVTSVTLKLSRRAYAEAIQAVGELRQRLLELAEDDPDIDEDAEIFQALLAVYPVTQEPRRRRTECDD